jgi:hypothetical protein
MAIGIFLFCQYSFSIEPIKPVVRSSDNLAPAPLPFPPPAKPDFIYPVWGFQVSLSPGMSRLSNSEISDGDIWDIEGGMGWVFDVKYFRTFSPYFRVMAGIGVDTYKEKLDISNYQTNFDGQRDIDDDVYNEHFLLENVSETTSLTYLSVPLILEFGNPNIDKIGFYVDAGIRLSFLMNDSYSGEGKYTTQGYYDKYNVLLHGVPELGFYDQKSIDKTNAAIKSMNIAFQGGAGITYPLSNMILLKAGLTANMGLTDISDPQEKAIDPSDPKYTYISSDNSLTANPNAKTLTRFVGFEVGIYFNRLLK